MKVRILILSFIAMLLFMPYSFAFSWQNDVDAAAQDASKIYEVYPYMPYSDFVSAWSNVPGWTCLSRDEDLNNGLQLKQATFRKNGIGDDNVIEEFHVLYEKDQVLLSSLCFKSEDKKILNRIFNYAVVRYNSLTKQHKVRAYDTHEHGLQYFIWWETYDDLMGSTCIVITLMYDKNDHGKPYIAITKTKEIGEE